MNSTTEIELNLKRFPLHSQASNVSAMLDYLHYCTGSPASFPVKQADWRRGLSIHEKGNQLTYYKRGCGCAAEVKVQSCRQKLILKRVVGLWLKHCINRRGPKQESIWLLDYYNFHFLIEI